MKNGIQIVGENVKFCILPREVWLNNASAGIYIGEIADKDIFNPELFQSVFLVNWMSEDTLLSRCFSRKPMIFPYTPRDINPKNFLIDNYIEVFYVIRNWETFNRKEDLLSSKICTTPSEFRFHLLTKILRLCVGAQGNILYLSSSCFLTPESIQLLINCSLTIYIPGTFITESKIRALIGQPHSFAYKTVIY